MLSAILPSNPRIRALLICGITAVLAMLTYYILPPSVNELARRTAAIFVVAALFWSTEVMPLYATSLCVVGMEILFLATDGGIASSLPAQSSWPMKPDGSGPVSLGSGEFLRSFASPIIILFLGGFLVSDALTKHGLDKVICAKLLKPFSQRPVTLLWAVLLITAFFSMWMSNTACTAMMLAIIAPIVRQLPADDKFHRGVILAVPFGANIGGIGTPIGTPPNAVALAALRMAGYDIGFLDWMAFAVPLMMIALVATGFILLWFFPPAKGIRLELKLDTAKKVDLPGRLTLLISLLAVVFWMTEKWHGVSEAVVALLAAASLTALGVLDRKDVDSTDWNVLILMWGGLSLGDAMNSSGLLKWAISLPIVETINSLPAPWSQYVMATFIVLLTVLFASFMSHTAATALIVPMAMALAPQEAGPLAILTALASSFAMAMPVSTPPNAMAFASGNIPAVSMIRSGALIGVVCILVLLGGHRLILPLFEAARVGDHTVQRRVAVLLPETGDYADMGRLQKLGYQLAARELERQGIEVRYFDIGKHTDNLSALVTEQLLPSKPDIIVGPYSSESAAALKPLLSSKGPPLLVPSAVVDALTQQANTSFYRVAPPSQMMAMTAAEFLAQSRDSLDLKSIAIIAEATDFGRSGAQSLTGTCLIKGLALPQAYFYKDNPGQWSSGGEPSLSPDTVLILITRNLEHAAALVKQYSPKHHLIGFAGAFSTPEFRSNALGMDASSPHGLYVLSPWREDRQSPTNEKFINDYAAANGGDGPPQYHTAQAYASLIVAGQAIEIAHRDFAKVTTVLRSIVVDTPLGPVRFINFGGYFQQNPATAVVQEIDSAGARTVYPLSGN